MSRAVTYTYEYKSISLPLQHSPYSLLSITTAYCTSNIILFISFLNPSLIVFSFPPTHFFFLLPYSHSSIYSSHLTFQYPLLSPSTVYIPSYFVVLEPTFFYLNFWIFFWRTRFSSPLPPPFVYWMAKLNTHTHTQTQTHTRTLPLSFFLSFSLSLLRKSHFPTGEFSIMEP